MTLEIISPEKLYYKGEVKLVVVPGAAGPFMILPRHASIISTLVEGDIVYTVGEEEHRLSIISGYVEVHNDVITVCVEDL